MSGRAALPASPRDLHIHRLDVAAVWRGPQIKVPHLLGLRQRHDAVVC